MIRRVSDLPQRPTGLGAMALVLLAAIGVWYLSGGDPGTSTTVPTARDTSSARADPSERAPAARGVDPDSGLPYVGLGELPAEADETLDLIAAGGPFPYGQDGGTFFNYEGVLPDEDQGYYQEFTVETPGSEDRGARRIVEGDEGELYWTADHYDSFERILTDARPR